MKNTRFLALLLVAGALINVRPAEAQSVLNRPPNLSGGWTGMSGQLHFNVIHRFQISGTSDKVTNTPTIFVTVGLPHRLLVGTSLSSNSLTDGFGGNCAGCSPNELELFARYGVLRESVGHKVDLSVQGGFNTATESFDGEITLGRWIDRVRFLGIARGFGNGYGSGDGRVAIGAGAVVRLGRFVAFSGDVVSLTARRTFVSGEKENIAWGLGLQLGIPYTPHTISLQATNTQTGSLQGSSVGSGQTRYGFEFTIPLMLGRYFGRSENSVDRVLVAENDEDEVVVEIRNMKFPDAIEIRPGGTIRFVNLDSVAHTVTADDGTWNSDLIEPGQSWTLTLSETGETSFHCIPHSFMRSVVRVG